MNVLNQIVVKTQQKVAYRKKKVPLNQLEKFPNYHSKRISLQESLHTKGMRIIAEIKFCSPSKGIIHSNIQPQEIALGYQNAGAAALSVLTEEDYFMGKMEYLMLARNSTHLPILRKDFMIDGYQIVEARAIGADAILLIAAILTKEQIVQFTKLAHQLELEVLLEVHSLEELKCFFFDEIDIVGVNNRNLKTLQVSLDTSLKIIEEIPKKYCKISESGLSQSADIHKLTQVGFDGFLMGENFMKESNPALALQNFIASL